MSAYINLNIEEFNEDNETYYVATSPDIQGLVAQGSTPQEAIEIAQSIAQIILEQKSEQEKISIVHPLPHSFNTTLLIQA